MFRDKLVLTGLAVLLWATTCLGLGRPGESRCFECKTHGERGTSDCYNPVLRNATSYKELVQGNPDGVVNCPSGWCRKKVETVKGKLSGEDEVSIERTCLQMPAPGGKERCLVVNIAQKPIQLCSCKGDLCNSAPGLGSTATTQFVLLLTLFSCSFKIFFD